MSKNQKNAAPKKKNKALVIVIIAVLLLVASGISVYAFLIKGKDANVDDSSTVTQSNTDDVGGRGLILTPENVQSFIDNENQPIDDTAYTCSMTTEWTYTNWEKPTDNVYVKNHEINTRTVYFDVYLDDANGDAIEDELIYSSPYLQVGAEIRSFALQKPVAAGSYTATVVYYLVDDDFEVITDVAVGIQLVVNE